MFIVYNYSSDDPTRCRPLCVFSEYQAAIDYIISKLRDHYDQQEMTLSQEEEDEACSRLEMGSDVEVGFDHYEIIECELNVPIEEEDEEEEDEEEEDEEEEDEEEDEEEEPQEN